jgi:hypothetical protein
MIKNDSYSDTNPGWRQTILRFLLFSSVSVGEIFGRNSKYISLFYNPLSFYCIIFDGTQPRQLIQYRERTE